MADINLDITSTTIPLTITSTDTPVEFTIQPIDLIFGTGGGGGRTQDLQDVTEVGNVTTLDIQTGNIITNTDGNAGSGGVYGRLRNYLAGEEARDGVAYHESGGSIALSTALRFPPNFVSVVNSNFNHYSADNDQSVSSQTKYATLTDNPFMEEKRLVNGETDLEFNPVTSNQQIHKESFVVAANVDGNVDFTPVFETLVELGTVTPNADGNGTDAHSANYTITYTGRHDGSTYNENPVATGRLRYNVDSVRYDSDIGVSVTTSSTSQFRVLENVILFQGPRNENSNTYAIMDISDSGLFNDAPTITFYSGGTPNPGSRKYDMLFNPDSIIQFGLPTEFNPDAERLDLRYYAVDHGLFNTNFNLIPEGGNVSTFNADTSEFNITTNDLTIGQANGNVNINFQDEVEMDFQSGGNVRFGVDSNIIVDGSTSSIDMTGGSEIRMAGPDQFKLQGGSNNQVLSTDGAGNLSWRNAGGGGNTVGTLQEVTTQGNTTNVNITTANIVTNRDGNDGSGLVYGDLRNYLAGTQPRDGVAYHGSGGFLALSTALRFPSPNDVNFVLTNHDHYSSANDTSIVSQRKYSTAQDNPFKETKSLTNGLTDSTNNPVVANQAIHQELFTVQSNVSGTPQQQSIANYHHRVGNVETREDTDYQGLWANVIFEGRHGESFVTAPLAVGIYNFENWDEVRFGRASLQDIGNIEINGNTNINSNSTIQMNNVNDNAITLGGVNNEITLTNTGGNSVIQMNSNNSSLLMTGNSSQVTVTQGNIDVGIAGNKSNINIDNTNINVELSTDIRIDNNSSLEINVDRFKLTGGANGQILTTSGSGNLSWQTPTAGQPPVSTFDNRNLNPATGERATFTDTITRTFGDLVNVGGGGNVTPVFWDGANWLVG